MSAKLSYKLLEFKSESGVVINALEIQRDGYIDKRLPTDVELHLLGREKQLGEALRAIVALDPNFDSENGFNEWGEAECFDKAKFIARAALNSEGTTEAGAQAEGK